MPELQLLRADHAGPLLTFETDNRAFFARTVEDRGDDYFATFPDHHQGVLDDQEKGVLRFHVLVADDGEILGRFNLYDLDGGTAEVGFRLAEKMTGRGVATQAVRDLCDLAKSYGLNSLRAGADVGNRGSRGVLRRAGFVQTGETSFWRDLHDEFLIGGELRVRRLGFGAMHLSPGDGEVARRAVDLGVTLIDTAYLYGWGANEELLARTLWPYRKEVLVTTKVGVARPGRLDGRPEVLRAQVDAALKRLRMDRLDLLQLHRVDPEVPLADQVGTLRDLRDQGKIGHIGLSEVTVDQLAEARGIVEVASVQNRYNLLDREHEPMAEACEAAGIAFLPWRPVLPGVTDPAVAEVAAEIGATPAQTSLAWLLSRSPVILPIPGTSTIAHLEENVAAGAVRLARSQRDRLG